jgi:hypothetical protein
VTELDHVGDGVVRQVAQAVEARVRGSEQCITAIDVEVCFHCGAEGVCTCVICVERAGQPPEKCRACLGTGYLTWLDCGKDRDE